MLATEGYPYEYKRGIGISFTDEIMDRSFISGLAQTENGDYISSGGRIMLVTGTGFTIEEALKSAYGSVRKIEFDKNEIFYRTDIAHRALLTK